MDILQTANERMEQLAALMNKDIEQKIPAGEKVKVGVDLGTSSIVFVVLDVTIMDTKILLKILISIIKKRHR